MDRAGVHRCALVPPVFQGERNDVVLEAARLHPDRFAAMGRLNLESADARERISTWRSQPGMLGLRFSFHRPSLAPLLLERRVEWLWEQAQRAEVPITMLIRPDMLPLVDEIAQRYPALKLSLDHLALPMDKKDADAFRHLDQLLRLARHANVM